LITKYKLENIVGRSPQMLQVYKTIARVAESVHGVDHRESGRAKN